MAVGRQGHGLQVVRQHDGTILIVSHDPDTDEQQRVVLLERQWRLLLCFLLPHLGRQKCCFVFVREAGQCAPTPDCVEA